MMQHSFRDILEELIQLGASDMVKMSQGGFYDSYNGYFGRILQAIC